MDSEQRPAVPGLNAAPGWYPVDQVNQQYWDGEVWTDRYAPLSQPAVSTEPTSDDRTYVVLMWVLGLVVGFYVPLIMWAVKRETPFVDYHGKQYLNMFLTSLIATLVSVVLMLVIIGFVLIFVVIIAYVVVSILAAIAASRGEYYEPPLTYQFIT